MNPIAICGAGPVGMALALMLARRGVAPPAMALLDARPLDQALADPRSLAVSYGSAQLLAQAGAWPVAGTAIHEIHVSRRGHFGRSLITRQDQGVPALGYVVRYGDLVATLAAACERAGIGARRQVRVAGAEPGPDAVRLALEGAGALDAAIVVQAEGGVFGQQSGKAVERDYGQTAVIARVSVAAPVAHRAFERFTDEGPLALLPQDGTDGHRYALVWCVQPARADALRALDDAAFLAALGAAFGNRLGRFTAVSARVGYRLGLNAGTSAAARMVAIGNAAQTLHPVAGQGLNLGLRDAAVLARLLADGATPDALAQFAQMRAADRAAIVRTTDTLARVFAHAGPAQALLGLGLGALDVVRPARSALAELMMFGRR